MEQFDEFYGPNAGYVLELYDRYRENPDSVDEATRRFFEHWTPPQELAEEAVSPALPLPTASAPQAGKAAAAVRLAQAIRSFGHLAAPLDPLGSPPRGDPWLEAAFHEITENELRQLPSSVIGGTLCEETQNAWQTIQALRNIYTNHIGYDYNHIHTPEERDWLREAAECGWFRPPKDPIDPLGLLERLTQVEAFEIFLHRIFPGKTRFSIEGLDMLVPMLDDLVGCAADGNMCTLLIGMSHRGRLNVLAHILGKPYAQILAEFKDPARYPTRDELGWMGDVKYHKGANRAVGGGEQVQLMIYMPPNPSHLEYVDPVIEGMARGAGSVTDQPGPPQFYTDASLPIILHGDASFPGQGVAAETLNFSRLPGYWVGGTIHIIANNQLGYTTLPGSDRSTYFASDLAKGFEIPILHVNADDPPACIEAVRTAFEYRQKFQKDFMIDLIGYRRYGHNEGDEPSFTQPRMYDQIEDHPSVRKIWANQLEQEGQIEADQAEAMVQQRMDELQEVLANLEPEKELNEPQLQPPPRGAARRVKTAVPLEELKQLNESLLSLPEGFHLHRKLERAMKRRRQIFDDPQAASIDWATAEELAFATILADGVPIRLTGEDVQRGTFSQRHSAFHDTENGEVFIPLQAIPQAKASYEVRNSPLSENAAVGFEYGFNIIIPNRLVIWEAQYGDFANGAQAMLDEFVLSARAKWEQTPSLVLLLPHGYEGQGPDHSSGRPERFLALADQNNLRLANCTTAAQYFHLLRRQAALLETDPLPLIVLTPKSLLRNPMVASSPLELAEGHWRPVIDDPQASQAAEKVRRLILCNGKVYVDLVSADERQDREEIALVRLEQLYPFPFEDVQQVIKQYAHLQEVVWVQEEPENMGAWTFVQPLLLDMIDGRWPLRFIGRPPSSSPAEGSSSWHSANQKKIISQAYDLENIRVKEG